MRVILPAILKLTELPQQALANPGELLAVLCQFLLQRVGRELRLGWGGGLRGRPRHVLDAAVRTCADPHHQNQTDDNPDDIGNNVQERVETEGDLPCSAATSNHG